MKQNNVAIVGAAESTEMGKLPDMSQIQIHADAALNAMKDAELSIKEIDGVAVELGEEVVLVFVPQVGRRAA